jgi:pSer/pThr/pTyr-binding forkhead associated (FHA) protein
MWKLTIEDDEGKQTIVPLTGVECVLGRADACTIQLGDRNISRRHASLVRGPASWLIRDHGSYNGTFVNGQRVEGEAPVQAGDVLQLGDYRLDLAEAAVHVTMPMGVPPPPPTVPAGAPVPHQRPDRLVVVVGPSPGSEYPLVGASFTIGRSEEATISINHASVSRMHADVVALGQGRFEVIDRDSANGIRINGVELRRGILEAGDALELGDVRLRFVGAGKLFRGADLTMQLRAVTLEQLGATAAPPPQRSRGLAVGLASLALVGLLVGGIAIAARAPSGGKVQLTQEQMDQAAHLLKKAKDKADAGDIDGAHALLEQIPEGAQQRTDPAVTAIEAKWADARFAEAEREADASKKRELWQKVAGAPLVDPERRGKAIDLLAKVSGAPSATAAPVALPRVFGTGAAPTSEKTASPVAPPVAVNSAIGLDQYSQRRPGLEAKVRSGKASVREIRELIAMCRHLGDRACVSMASSALQKQSNPTTP